MRVSAPSTSITRPLHRDVMCSLAQVVSYDHAIAAGVNMRDSIAVLAERVQVVSGRGDAVAAHKRIHERPWGCRPRP
jgi:hypothetical protein